MTQPELFDGLRIPMRGYEVPQVAEKTDAEKVTNPHAGL